MTTTSRPASLTDFTVPVEGIGVFTFARRNFKDEIAIQAAYARHIQGTHPTEWLAMVAGWMAVLETLTVAAPDGWDLWGLDPLDDDSYDKLSRVHAALAEKERSFRRKPGATGAGNGAGAVENGGVLVPSQIQPAA